MRIRRFLVAPSTWEKKVQAARASAISTVRPSLTGRPADLIYIKDRSSPLGHDMSVDLRFKVFRTRDRATGKGVLVMTMRKLIEIDDAKCDGCGECVTSCAEGAIAIIDGKARLVSEIYCDGLGACLGRCPQGAITIEEREAAAFDEAETQKHLARLRGVQAEPASIPVMDTPHQCPGSAMRSFGRPATASGSAMPAGPMPCELTNWPIQLTLVPPMAPYLQGADILLVADCVPFAYADFHRRFLKDKPVIIGCPKLDQMEAYAKKLTEIVRVARPKSLTVLHMEVPCCSGFTRLAQYALHAADSPVPVTDLTIGIRGEIMDTVELSAGHVAHREVCTSR